MKKKLLKDEKKDKIKKKKAKIKKNGVVVCCILFFKEKIMLNPALLCSAICLRQDFSSYVYITNNPNRWTVWVYPLFLRLSSPYSNSYAMFLLNYAAIKNGQNWREKSTFHHFAERIICPFLSPTFYLYLSSIFRLFEDGFENFWFTVLLKG